jgi:superfamily II DNA or RNA helicase
MSREKIEASIVKSIPKNKRVRLHLAPRFGKTKLIISVIERDKPEKILWVTPSKKLAEEDIPSEFKKWGAEKYLDNLTLTTWASLKNVTGNFDLIVLDEEQFATEKNCDNILKNKLKGRIISMTGTPSTRSDKEDLYWRLGMNVCYQVTIDEAIELGIVSDYQITVYRVAMDEEENLEAGSEKNRFITSEAAYYRYLDKEAIASYGMPSNGIPWAIAKRATTIKDSPTKKELARRLLEKECKGRTLIFAPFIKDADAICKDSYHSKSESKESLEKFQSFEVDRLSLVNSGGVGFTFEGIEYLIIMQMDSNKTGLSTQKMARALLKQDGKDKVQIYVLCLRDTKDEDWVSSGLNGFDRTKIKVINVRLAA